MGTQNEQGGDGGPTGALLTQPRGEESGRAFWKVGHLSCDLEDKRKSWPIEGVELEKRAQACAKAKEDLGNLGQGVV